jgi:glycosyltransferase involved in cell wall biosynthesis
VTRPTILVDLAPATGAHGVRGIGSYVRGIGEAVRSDPDLRRRVVTLQATGEGGGVHRGVVAGLRPQDIGWATGWFSDAMALRRSGASAMHQTDPLRPFRPSGARRVAVTAYDLIPLEPEHRAAERWHRQWIYRRYLRSLRSADRVIAISRTTADAAVARLGVDPSRVDVVYPVVAGSPHAARWQTTGEPTFLFVGVPAPHKRPELAIAALGAYRERHEAGRLRFIGPLAPAHRDLIAASAARAGVSDAVSIEGRVTADSLEAAYLSATALLAVSRLEGFGLPPVEAAIRGVPVVAADSAIARETLGEAASYADADPEMLAEAMATAVPPPEAERLRLVERHAAVTVARQLSAAYDALTDA